MNLKKTMSLWGILDVAAVVWYCLWNVISGTVPFLDDIVSAHAAAQSFGSPFGLVATYLGLSLYLSLIVSGYFLFRNKRAGVIMSYIQTPFRFIAIIPPSIFFLTWPLK